jgi:hypothetical protein
MSKTEHRRASRIALNLPMVIEPIVQPEVELHENLAQVYTRVSAAAPDKTERFPGTLRDLSTNGAFIAGEPMPLLSRVAFVFELQGFGRVEAIGWTLWRRAEDCEVPMPSGEMGLLPKGFGILFEAIPLDARIAIHRLVQRRSHN